MYQGCVLWCLALRWQTPVFPALRHHSRRPLSRGEGLYCLIRADNGGEKGGVGYKLGLKSWEFVTSSTVFISECLHLCLRHVSFWSSLKRLICKHPTHGTTSLPVTGIPSHRRVPCRCRHLLVRRLPGGSFSAHSPSPWPISDSIHLKSGPTSQ